MITRQTLTQSISTDVTIAAAAILGVAEELEGTQGGRVYLCDLRRECAQFTRETLDVALQSLQVMGELVLMPLDDPMERTAARQAAALYIAGEPRHILRLQSR